jgi:hypothetical protein
MTSKHARRVTGGGGLLLLSLAICGGGCNPFDREEARPLTADAFVQQRVEGRVNPEPIDQPGQVIVGGVRAPAEDENARPAPQGRPVRNANEISPTVRQSVRAPGDPTNGRATAAATTPKQPTRTPGATTREAAAPAKPRAAGAVDPSGQYVIFGTVLAQVNNRPIYAHKLLAVLDSALRAEAQRFDERQFKPIAAELIRKEIRTQQQNELVFALAEKSLDAREKMVAEALTAQWQNEEITKAGGSIELARRRWADDGWDFDDRLDYQYRVNMTRVFYQRRVFPLVHVTASDIRHYYEQNKATEFTRPARAKFRVIKIDPRQLKLPGGASEAKKYVTDVRAKAVANANFEQLARELNDPALKASGGLIGADGWLERGSYVAEKVEAAAWALKPGEVTDVIEERGAFYVAKLEDKQDAVGRDFEDPQVQQAIIETLRAQQFKQLQEQRQEKLLKDAVIQEHPQMMQVALDMAMQRYAAWRETAVR